MDFMYISYNCNVFITGVQHRSQGVKRQGLGIDRSYFIITIDKSITIDLIDLYHKSITIELITIDKRYLLFDS